MLLEFEQNDIEEITKYCRSYGQDYSNDIGTCQLCLRKNIPLTTHHLIPLCLKNNKSHSKHNLILICPRCHNAINISLADPNIAKLYITKEALKNYLPVKLTFQSDEKISHIWAKYCENICKEIIFPAHLTTKAEIRRILRNNCPFNKNESHLQPYKIWHAVSSTYLNKHYQNLKNK